jgi:hypothetical protein
MAGDAELRRAIVANRDVSAQVRRRVVQFVERYWRSMPAYRDADLDRFVKAVLPVVAGGQVQMAQLTASYLASIEQLITGQKVRPVPVRPRDVSTETLRGVPPTTVYRRPGVTVWMALQKGTAFPAAVSSGLNRALDIVTTDLQLARTHTARQSMEGSANVVGYRRVLTGGEDCALCAVASTQRYHVEDLLPIHPGCDCDVAPIIGDRDPGRIINQGLLDDTHEEIAARFGESSAGAGEIPNTSALYRDVMIRTHGEMGPLLTIRGHDFTGPDDI